jgi:alpha-tubulin suppressor-like RCC1 family protein
MGTDNSCALTDTGEVKCWGWNPYGQLGDGTNIERHTPTDVVGLGSSIAVTTGGDHTCAIELGGLLKCWGWNGFGQLGNGEYNGSYVPVAAQTGEPIVAAGAGVAHTCALAGSGAVKCWGFNQYGQLGDGTQVDHIIPADTLGLPATPLDVVVGSHHSCAVGSMWIACWGDNRDGQLGDGTTSNRPDPVEPQFPDDDGDGVSNLPDECPRSSNSVLAPLNGPITPTDFDCDGFAGSHEGLLGTDPNDPCGFIAGGGTPSETWPPDLLPTNTITIQDVLALKPVFGGSSARHDLVTSGTITIQDVLAIKPYFGKSCTP